MQSKFCLKYLKIQSVFCHYFKFKYDNLKLLKYDNDGNYKNTKLTSSFTNLIVYPWRNLRRIGWKCVVKQHHLQIYENLANYISHQDTSIFTFILITFQIKWGNSSGIRGKKKTTLKWLSKWESLLSYIITVKTIFNWNGLTYHCYIQLTKLTESVYQSSKRQWPEKI